MVRENPTFFCTENLSVDPYFTHYDPINEHGEFSEALERLDKKHTKLMTKVNKKHTKLMTRVQ